MTRNRTSVPARNGLFARRILFTTALFGVACYNPGGVTASNSGVYDIVASSNASSEGVFVDDQVQVVAYPIDITGLALPQPVTFSSSATNVATITSGGLITATGPGTTFIIMSAGAVTRQLSFLVDGNVTGSVVVGPNAATIKVGAQQLFTAVVLTTKGNPAHGKTVTWSSTDPSRAPVDATGRTTAIAAAAGVSICAAATDVPSLTGCGTLVVTP